MNEFNLYFSLGWNHIIDYQALDHILFIVALSAIYLFRNWKQVLVLVTAFTLGHSLTLALSIFNLVRIENKWVEFLIPVTILVTALFNFFQKNHTLKHGRLNYFFAGFFGLIHGLGYANYIRFMMANDDRLGWNLFYFNIGLELGQVLVVLAVLVLSHIAVDRLKLKRKWWINGLSALAFLVALKLLLNAGSILFKN